jgi:hypothetical protein
MRPSGLALPEGILAHWPSRLDQPSGPRDVSGLEIIDETPVGERDFRVV